MPKLNKETIVWECDCGHREFADESPDECTECLKLDTFTQLPPEFSSEKDLSEDLE
tara:strand:+ start:1192 stop:1359 length:168 start_codon:yes stop_codon:yes gene_type:complete